MQQLKRQRPNSPRAGSDTGPKESPWQLINSVVQSSPRLPVIVSVETTNCGKQSYSGI